MMRYEWKKIFERKLNVAAMALGYFLIGVCVFFYITQTSFYDEETGSYLEGIEAIRLRQARDEGQTDRITEEYITKLIEKIQSYQMDLESDEAYTQVIRPLGDIFYFVSQNYTDMRSDRIDCNALMKVDLSQGSGFYEQRMKKIRDFLNTDFSYGNYTEAEKSYWIRKAEATALPFRWGSMGVMDSVWYIVLAGFYLWFAVVVCVSPVFASEYESGAASLLLTAKYGKSRMIWSKIIVAALFTAGYLTGGMLLGVTAFGLLLGFPGADLPVQLWNSVIPYNLTVGQACLGALVLNVFIGTVIALMLLCCSASLRSSLATLVIGMAVIIAPAFFGMSKKSGLWNHINYLFPVRVMDLQEALGSYVSYAAGSLVIPYIGMVVIVYTVIGVVSLGLVKRGFLKMK